MQVQLNKLIAEQREEAQKIENLARNGTIDGYTPEPGGVVCRVCVDRSDDLPNARSCSKSVPKIDWQWEISHGALLVKEKLGSGAFGAVFEGYLSGPAPANKLCGVRFASQLYADCVVAVKMLPEFANNDMRQDFMEEMKVISC